LTKEKRVSQETLIKTFLQQQMKWCVRANRMNRKIISSIALITIVALSIASGFGYYQILTQQNQISELQDQNNELQDQINELQDQNSELQSQLNELENINAAHDVKIIAFEWVSGFNPIVGITLGNDVKVTVKNMGVNDVSGLNLTVRLLLKENRIELAYSRGFSEQINVLHAGESREISHMIYYSLANMPTNVTECVSTLRLGDFVLDEWAHSF
jgi:cell division protein FtsB